MLDESDKKNEKLTVDPCNNLKIKLEKCLTDNKEKIEFCRDIRQQFEKCINKKKEINEFIFN